MAAIYVITPEEVGKNTSETLCLRFKFIRYATEFPTRAGRRSLPSLGASSPVSFLFQAKATVGSTTGTPRKGRSPATSRPWTTAEFQSAAGAPSEFSASRPRERCALSTGSVPRVR